MQVGLVFPLFIVNGLSDGSIRGWPGRMRRSAPLELRLALPFAVRQHRQLFQDVPKLVAADE